MECKRRTIYLYKVNLIFLNTINSQLKRYFNNNTFKRFPANTVKYYNKTYRLQKNKYIKIYNIILNLTLSHTVILSCQRANIGDCKTPGATNTVKIKVITTIIQLSLLYSKTCVSVLHFFIKLSG